MSTYLIQATKRPRGFRVIGPQGQPLAEMHYRSWSSQSMEGVVEGRPVKVTVEGFWRPRHGVFVDGTRVGTISTSVWSQLKWNLSMNNAAPVELEFVSAGFWGQCYQLRVTKGVPLLTVKPVNRWSSFSTDFAVEVNGPGIAADQMPLMLVLAGFSARLKRAYAHAAAAA